MVINIYILDRSKDQTLKVQGPGPGRGPGPGPGPGGHHERERERERESFMMDRRNLGSESDHCSVSLFYVYDRDSINRVPGGAPWGFPVYTLHLKVTRTRTA